MYAMRTYSRREVAGMAAACGARALAITSAILVLTAGPGPASALAADEVKINLEGTITPSCALSGVATSAALGNLAAASGAPVTVAFTVDCNAPFKYALSSVNGALKHQTIGSAPSGFEIVREYSVRTQIATNSGAGIDQTCTSASIKTGAVTCAFTNSGTAVAIGKAGSLALSWTAGGQPLVAGTYQDTLTLTVSVQP